LAVVPAVSIVVLNWNGAADTIACLEALRRLRYPDCRIVVVDNASTDDSVAALRAEAAQTSFELIEAGSNLGYAGGNNLGIRHALDDGADFVLVLNNDTTVDPMLLDELVAAANRYPGAGCFGPWIYYMHEPERLWFTRSEWVPADSAFSAPGKGRLGTELPAEPASTGYVCGAALFFRADVARRIGLFDERFFLVYEDSDWCFRARRTGFECVVVPTARVWHKVGTSFGSEASPLRTYFSVRNKLLWAEKNLGRPEWSAILYAALRRLFPRFAIERVGVTSTPRALLWAATGFAREWSRMRHDPQQLAHRRGVLDYLLRRFGDCPSEIRALSRAWATNREASDARDGLAT
jgi:GT2 family glycosyltransferase